MNNKEYIESKSTVNSIHIIKKIQFIKKHNENISKLEKSNNNIDNNNNNKEDNYNIVKNNNSFKIKQIDIIVAFQNPNLTKEDIKINGLTKCSSNWRSSVSPVPNFPFKSSLLGIPFVDIFNNSNCVPPLRARDEGRNTLKRMNVNIQRYGSPLSRKV
ncbi:hypothetical protein H8356DRAFT_1364021 [Neocallimastix lanati (nom. inval.)]|nr:hypothetical protein H8356DRAFT_1364021 [Neocallimastix sp. JGI-2020a]